MKKMLHTVFTELKKDARVLQERGRKGFPANQMPYPVPPHQIGNIVIWVYDGSLVSGKTHTRDYFAFQYVYKGHVNEDINGKLIPLEEGDILLVQPHVRQGVSLEGLSPEGRDTCIIYFALKKEWMLKSFLAFLPENTKLLPFFVNSFNNNNTGQYLIVKNTDSAINDIIEMLIMEYVGRKLYYTRVIEGLMTVFISMLARDSTILETDITQNSVTTQILNYLKEHCTTATLQATADAFNYHPNYLCALLRKKTGQNFSSLIRDFRLEKACFLITNTGIPISEIAATVGYQNASHFYKIFQAKYGVLPSSFR